MSGLIERLTLLCFAGTYGLALASDLARFVVRWHARWYVTVGLTALGWIVQTAYLANSSWQGDAELVTTPFGSLLILAWILAGIDLYLLVRSPRTAAAGLFVLPVVLGLVAAAAMGAKRSGWVGDLATNSPAVTFWGVTHGLLLTAGSVFTCVATAAGLMYLVQSNRLKHKRPPRFGLALPSLEQSERLNRAAITAAFPLLTAGLIIGLILTVVGHRATGTTIRWTDPKVVSTLAMWVVFAVLLHARYRPEMRGRRVMLLSVLAFLFLAFSLFGLELLRIPSAHGGPRSTRGESPGRTAIRTNSLWNFSSPEPMRRVVSSLRSTVSRTLAEPVAHGGSPACRVPLALPMPVRCGRLFRMQGIFRATQSGGGNLSGLLPGKSGGGQSRTKPIARQGRPRRACSRSASGFCSKPFIPSTISLVSSTGAGRPGISAVVMTTSACAAC